MVVSGSDFAHRRLVPEVKGRATSTSARSDIGLSSLVQRAIRGGGHHMHSPSSGDSESSIKEPDGLVIKLFRL